MNRRDLIKMSVASSVAVAGCANLQGEAASNAARASGVYDGDPLGVTETAHFNVREFGATGDGETYDTDAIQEAIDACHGNGGGIVWVPAGQYHIATIELKSFVTLSLDYGATILGSQKLSDYRSERMVEPREGGPRTLIYAANATEIAIEGLGVIDGRGKPEFFPRDVNGKQRPRPRLVRFQNCSGITFSGNTYKDPAFWGIYVIDSDNVHFNGVKVRFRNNGRNNDGLDIDGCSNVLIENCDIDSGDDAICLKSSKPHPCENITVRTCRVASNTSPLKFGTSSRGGFVNVSVSNCYFYNSPMGAIKLQIVDGGRMEGVEISRIFMEDVGNPIFIRLGNRGRSYEEALIVQRQDEGATSEGVSAGSIKGLYLHDMDIRVTGEDRSRSGPIMITGIPGHYVEDVRLENIKISYPGNGTQGDAGNKVAEDIARYPEQFFFGVLPAWGAYVRHAKNVRFNNVQLSTRNSDARQKMILDDVENFVE